MRNFIDMLNEGRSFQLANYSTYDLPAGTVLHHGTNATRNFNMLVKRPTWFALRLATAERWSGWHQSDRRNQGPERILSYVTTRDLVLLDRRGMDWDTYTALAMALTGDSEPSPYNMAYKLKAHCDGWIGDGEIMLCDPRNVEKADPKIVTESQDISSIIDSEIGKTGMEPEDINDGWCFFFADNVVERLGGKSQETFAYCPSENDIPSQTFDPTAPTHCVIWHKGRVYDSECPHGEDRWQDLPYFKRRSW